MLDKETINLKDVYIIIYSCGKYVNICKHPYYVSLMKNDKDMFHEFVSHSKHQLKKPSAKWKNFKEIYKDIKQHGYDFSNDDKITIIQKNGKLVCHKGKHRLCILLKIYGKDLKIDIDHNKMVNFHM